MCPRALESYASRIPVPGELWPSGQQVQSTNEPKDPKWQCTPFQREAAVLCKMPGQSLEQKGSGEGD